MKKFKLENVAGSNGLFRIVALRDITLDTSALKNCLHDSSLLHDAIPTTVIKAGEVGGIVEKEENLSQEGNCWIFPEASVFNDARVEDNAILIAKGRMDGKARIRGSAIVGGHVRGNAVVQDNATVESYCGVWNNAVVKDNAILANHAVIRDNATAAHYSILKGHTVVQDNAIIDGNAMADGYSTICNNAHVCGFAVVKDYSVIKDNATIDTENELCGNVVVGGNSYIGGDCHIQSQHQEIIDILGSVTLVDGTINSDEDFICISNGGWDKNVTFNKTTKTKAGHLGNGWMSELIDQETLQRTLEELKSW